MNFLHSTIEITDDFDLDKILSSGQCFRPERRADGWYRFLCGRNILYLRPMEQGRFEMLCERGAWKAVWENYFDLSRDYAALRSSLSGQAGQNPFLVRALESGAGLRVLRQDPWEMLVTFIISQRKSIPAIRTAINLLAQTFGEAVQGAGETVYLFPSAGRLAAVPEEELHRCGLGYRTHYVSSAAQQAAQGTLDLKALAVLNDTALFSRLQELEGVGKKVANCVCLFGYGRAAMAPIDVWVERLINDEFAGVNPFPQYGEVAGIVQQYLFCYKRDVSKEERRK